MHGRGTLGWITVLGQEKAMAGLMMTYFWPELIVPAQWLLELTWHVNRDRAMGIFVSQKAPGKTAFFS